MSIKAYKIIEIESAKNPSFNCWNDDWLFDNDLTVNKFYGGYEAILLIEKSTIVEAIDSGEYKGKQLKTLKNILKDFSEDETYILYECF